MQGGFVQGTAAVRQLLLLGVHKWMALPVQGVMENKAVGVRAGNVLFCAAPGTVFCHGVQYISGLGAVQSGADLALGAARHPGGNAVKEENIRPLGAQHDCVPVQVKTRQFR